MPSSESSIRELVPMRMFRDLVRHRDLIGRFAWRDAIMRYKGSYFGILWSFVVPIMMLIVYVFVFSVIFQARWGAEGSRLDYGLTIFCGIIVFNIFGECAQRAPGIVLANPNYVKKVVFPLEVLPVAALGSSLVNLGFGLVILLPAWAIVHHTVSSTIWLFPLVLVPLVGITLGISWLLAALGVFIRDIAQPVFVLVQALFFLSGIFLPISALPAYLRTPLSINPLATILEDGRRTLLWGQMPQWSWWAIDLGVAAVVLFLGYFVFMRSKKAFADVM